MNRNHWFMLGVVILLLGFQLRSVDSFILNAPSSQFIASKLKPKDSQQVQSNPFVFSIGSASSAIHREKIQPPRWLGWVLVSVGAVLILHSFAMNKPE